MPSVFRVGPYRGYFWSREDNEPEHVHVESSEGEAKVWLSPVAHARSRGFNARQIAAIISIVEDRRELCLRAWNDHLKGGGS